MNKIVIVSSIVFSLLATAIMTYISMATPIGPWVELIIVLAATTLFRLALGYVASERLKNAVGLTTVAAGVAGIAATVCGFTVPTLYFLDKELFSTILADSWQTMLLTGGSILVGGGFAFVMVGAFGERMLADTGLSFPIGQMVRKMIVAQNQLRKALELCAGIVVAFAYAFMQRCACWIPQKVVLGGVKVVSALTLPSITIRFDLLPLFVAIGYVAGEVLTLPLGVGVISKLFLLEPLKHYAFSDVPYDSFILAFGAGMMIQGAVFSFSKVPHLIVSTWKKITAGELQSRRRGNWLYWGGRVLFAAALYAYFRYYNLSLLAQLYMVAFAAICVYQLMIIGGKIGLAPFGRFATFVMLPGFLLFGYDNVQVMLVSLFVSLAGGIAVDIMFGRKLGQLADINKKEIVWMQLLGLVVSAIAFGFIFTQLVHHFGLGSAELVAQRARSRALLVSVSNFRYILVAAGALFGFILEYIGVNALLVFTGLLFPVDFSLMLIVGGSLTYVAQDKDEWDPFWSGVFAATSLWMVIRGFV